MKYCKLISIVCVIITLAVLFQPCAKAESDRMQVLLENDPTLPANETYNLGTPNNLTSNYEVFVTDLDRMGYNSNGTYVGPLMPPSVVRLHWHPRRSRETIFPNCPNITVEATVNFTSNEIMNGASGFWIMIPISLNSLEHIVQNNFTDVFMLVNITDLETNITVQSNSIPDIYPAPFNDPDNLPLSQENRLYYYFHSTILPDRKYKIEAQAFNVSSNIDLFVTNEDVCGGNQETTITYEHVGYQEKQTEQFDLAWSFLFPQGMGIGQQFGETVRIPKNSFIELYPQFEPTGPDNYLSVMFPFVSDRPVELQAIVFRLVGMQFTDTTTVDTVPLQFTYSGYILGTSEKELDVSTYDPGDQIVVQIRFDRTENITVLCKHDWGERWLSLENLDPGGTDWYIYIGHFNRPEIYLSLTDGRWGQADMDHTGHVLYSYGLSNNVHVGRNYIVVIDPGANKEYATQDIWGGFYDPTADPRVQEALDKIDWGFDWDEIGTGENMKKYAANIMYYVKAGIFFMINVSEQIYTKLSEGLTMVYGWVKQFADWVWSGLLKVGELVYNVAMQFVQWIKSIISAIAEAFGTILDFTGILITISLFLCCVALVAIGKQKIVKWIDENEQERRNREVMEVSG